MRLPLLFARNACAAAVGLLAAVLPLRPALAAEYSDLWVTPGEDAWGVNFVQWGNDMFATFYNYGADNRPTWYTAVLDLNGTGNYTGILYSNIGTYFAAPWKASDHVESVAGTAAFLPSTINNYEGTLIYTVNGVPTITKSVQRLPSPAPIPAMGGTYYGGQVGRYSSCTNTALNTPYSDSFTLNVTQSGNTLSLGFTYASTLVCTLSGTLSQNGLLYSIVSATYLCSDQTDTTGAVSDIKLTAQGIEGQFSAPAPINGAGCHEDARFSAARN